MKLQSIVCLLVFLVLGFVNSEQTLIGWMTITQNSRDPTTVNKNYKLIPSPTATFLQNLKGLPIKVVKAEPYDACEPIQQIEESQIDVYVMVEAEQTKCLFKRKKINVKNSLAKGVIFVSSDMQKVHSISSSREFHSFMLQSKDAAQIVGPQADFVEFEAQVSMEAQNNTKTKMEIWVSSLSKQSYELLKSWEQIMQNIPSISNKVLWRPRYVFIGSKSDQGHVASCACLGYFCSPQINERISDAAVKQDIRQKLLFETGVQNYFQYINAFVADCFDTYHNTYYADDCSRSVLNKLSLATDVVSRTDNFVYNCSSDLQIYGNLTSDKSAYVGSYPSVILSGESLQFKNKNQLASQLCRKLSLESETGCVELAEHTTLHFSIVSVFFFVAIILGLILIALVIIFCYRKTLRKEMHKETRMQVSTAVEQYYALADTTK